MGGLDGYQKASLVGQSGRRGGDTSKWLIPLLKRWWFEQSRGGGEGGCSEGGCVEVDRSEGGGGEVDRSEGGGGEVDRSEAGCDEVSFGNADRSCSDEYTSVGGGSSVGCSSNADECTSDRGCSDDVICGNGLLDGDSQVKQMAKDRRDSDVEQEMVDGCEGKRRLRLLDVGALRNNYERQKRWIEASTWKIRYMTK